MVRVSTPSVDSSWGMKMLPSVLSMIAGSADVIGFLGLGGLFTAHITGSLILSLNDSPSTAVITTNITRFVMDVGEVLLRNDPDKVAEARRRARHTFPAIMGFSVGAGLGEGCFVVAGLWSLMLPTALALLALAISLTAPER